MSSKNLEPIIEDYQKRVDQSEQRDTIIENLYTDGLTIIDAIKVVRVLYKLDLKEAHFAVAGHPTWESTVKNAEPLHNEMEEALQIMVRLGWARQTGPSSYFFDLSKSFDEEHERLNP